MRVSEIAIINDSNILTRMVEEQDGNPATKIITKTR